MLRSTKVAGVHHATGQQRRQDRVVMVIIIPWGCTPPTHTFTLPSLHPVSSLYFSPFLIAFCCLCLYDPSLSLPVTHCSVFVPPSSSGFFPFSLNVFCCSHLSSCFLFSLLSFVPVVLTSCPAIEGERSRGRKGMLILSPQRRSAGGGRKRERERKMSLVWGNELAVALCMCVLASQQER